MRVSYVVTDLGAEACAVVDSLLNYEVAPGRTHTTLLDLLIAFVGVFVPTHVKELERVEVSSYWRVA